MTELEKIAYAKDFLDKLANGINPLDGTTVPATDVAGQPRVKGCCRYVSEILGLVIENGGVYSRRKPHAKKTEYTLSAEMLSRIQYSSTPIPLSDLIRQLNELRDPERMKRISIRAVSAWLISIDALEAYVDAQGRNTKRPTANGRALGISVEMRVGERGEYPVNVYNAAAQQFIVENLYEILAAELSDNP